MRNNAFSRKFLEKYYTTGVFQHVLNREKKVRMTPYVTVIVTAYNRQEFLNAALESLIAQDAQAGEFEVIVVKNFENSEVERTIDRMGAHSIYDNSPALHSFSAEAVRRARGEVLCFLDDDDLFLPDKISTVMSIFRNNPEIDYYHNAIDYIDTGGNVIAPPFSFRFSVLERKGGAIVLKHDEVRMKVQELVAGQCDYNNSSISVRKKILYENLEVAGKTVSAHDSLLFYLAAMCGRALMIDSRVLTHYRLNGKSVTVSSRYEFSARQVKTFTVLSEFADAMGEKEIACVLKRQTYLFELIKNISDPEVDMLRVAGACISFMRHSACYGRAANLFPQVLAAVYILSPRLSRKIYKKVLMARL